MGIAVVYPHIQKTGRAPARLERHKRTRVSMIVADYVWRGWSAEEMVRQYPYLTLAEIHAALTYYFDHRREIDAELEAESHEAAAWKRDQPTSPKLAKLKKALSY